MTAAFNNRVGDKIAAFRAECMRHEMAKLLEAERVRLNETDRQIDMRAYTYAPADRTKQQMARRWLTNAAMIAETGSAQENSK
jgi:hypothetical protein